MLMRQQRASGFTIVELLIVIVVIAILAVISIVAYSGIQNGAVKSSIQTSLRDASTRIAVQYAMNETYPATEAEMRTVTKLKDGNSIVYRYTYESANNSYCLSGITDRSGVKSFHITNQGNSPAEGACDGHSGAVSQTITNLSTNPSVETGTTGFSGPNSSTVMRDASRAHSGGASLRVTMPGNVTMSQVGATLYQRNPFATYLNPNTTYTFSAYVYVPTGSVNMQLSVQGSGRGSVVSNADYRTTVKDQWVRINKTFTTNSGGSITIYALNDATTPSGNTQFWVDLIMLTEGSDLHGYADGSSSGWSWSGDPHASTSSGPAL